MENTSEDAQVHYDLGFAYYEMGLLADALSELELALKKDPKHQRAPETRRLVESLRNEVGRS